MRHSILLLLALVAVSCISEVDPVTACEVSQDSVRYFAHVFPIIDRTCAVPTCHVNGFEHGNFNNSEDLQKAASSGKLEFMIKTRQMPPAISPGKLVLTDCEITTIRAWIKN